MIKSKENCKYCYLLSLLYTPRMPTCISTGCPFRTHLSVVIIAFSSKCVMSVILAVDECIHVRQMPTWLSNENWESFTMEIWRFKHGRPFWELKDVNSIIDIVSMLSYLHIYIFTNIDIINIIAISQKNSRHEQF